MEEDDGRLMKKEANLNLEKVKIDVLVPLEYNPNEIKGRNKERLEGSLDKFGYLQPIVVNRKNMNIIGGNQRYRYFKERGYQEIDVIYVDLDVDKEKTLAYLLNVTGENDSVKLANMILSIEDDSLVKDYLKFFDEEIDNLKLITAEIEDTAKIAELEDEITLLELRERLLATKLNDLTFKDLLKLFNEWEDFERKVKKS